MEQLSHIRAAAHKAFLCKRTSQKPDKALPRSNIAGLREAILLHRCRFAAARASTKYTCAIRTPKKLGSAPPRVGPLWTARAEAIERWLNRAQRKRKLIHRKVCDVVTCTMPHELLAIRAKRYAVRHDSKRVVRTTPSSDGSDSGLSDTSSSTATSSAITDMYENVLSDTRGYAQHIARCAGMRGRVVGEGASTTLTRVYKPNDTAASIRAIYAGLPDELYRRQAGRRYGRWLRTVALKGTPDALQTAEAEMARRRGYDRLRTASAPNAANTFAFDGGSEYAFSTRITAAPRLQAAMVAKYNSPAPRPLVEVDARARAVAFAEQRPMFHTKVMDRFR